jgi:hypothetical protein
VEKMQTIIECAVRQALEDAGFKSDVKTAA